MDIVEYHGRPMKAWEMDLNYPKPDKKGRYSAQEFVKLATYKDKIERGEIKPDTRLLDIVKKKKGPAPLARTTTKVGKVGSATNPRVVTGISFVRGNIPQRGPHYHRWVDENVPDDSLIIVHWPGGPSGGATRLGTQTSALLLSEIASCCRARL